MVIVVTVVMMIMIEGSDDDDSDYGGSDDDDSNQVRVLAGVEFTRRGVARPTNNGGRLCRC